MHRTASIQIAAILGVAGLSTFTAAQQRAADLGSILLQTPAVRAAVDFARTDEMRTIDDQIRICEVEAPPFQEAKRAEMYAELLREAGLKNVRIDAEGNVIAERPGANRPAECRHQRPPRYCVSPRHQRQSSTRWLRPSRSRHRRRLPRARRSSCGRESAEQSRRLDAGNHHLRRHGRRRGARRPARGEAPLQRDA